MPKYVWNWIHYAHVTEGFLASLMGIFLLIWPEAFVAVQSEDVLLTLGVAPFTVVWIAIGMYSLVNSARKLYDGVERDEVALVLLNVKAALSTAYTIYAVTCWIQFGIQSTMPSAMFYLVVALTILNATIWDRLFFLAFEKPHSV